MTEASRATIHYLLPDEVTPRLVMLGGVPRRGDYIELEHGDAGTAVYRVTAVTWRAGAANVLVELEGSRRRPLVARMGDRAEARPA